MGIGTLRLDLKAGESVRVGDTIITLEEKSGKAARLAFKADKSVPITRIEPRVENPMKNGIGFKE